jgi:hypothetical protein
LRDMTRSNNSKVIFMPVETASMLSAVGSIKEMFMAAEDKPTPAPDPRQPQRPGMPPPPPPRELPPR